MRTGNTNTDATHLLGAAAALALAAAASGQQFLLDFGATDPSGVNTTPVGTVQSGTNYSGVAPDGNTWNNFRPGIFIRLYDTAGNLSSTTEPAGIGFGATSAVGASNLVDPGGLNFPSPALLGDLAVDTATRDFCFRDDDFNDPFMSFTFNSVAVENTYTVRIYAGRQWADQEMFTTFDIYGDFANLQTQTIQTSGPGIGEGGSDLNDNTVVEFTGVQPDEQGLFYLDVYYGGGGVGNTLSQYYINALELINEQGAVITFTSQPVSTIADAGSTLAFSAQASSSGGGATYQWTKDGLPLTDDGRITGATTDSLSVAQAGLDDVGYYQLTVTDTTISADSAEVIGAVRGTPLTDADFDNNGVYNFFDVLSFLQLFESVTP